MIYVVRSHSSIVEARNEPSVVRRAVQLENASLALFASKFHCAGSNVTAYAITPIRNEFCIKPSRSDHIMRTRRYTSDNASCVLERMVLLHRWQSDDYRSHTTKVREQEVPPAHTAPPPKSLPACNAAAAAILLTRN